MAVSLYLKTANELRKEEILKLLSSSNEKSKVEAMKEIISQLSRGKELNFISFHITKHVLTVKSNELRRLFYYYLELIPKNKEDGTFNEFLLLSNQIRKDLEHPNEYVRGFSMRFVSTLIDPELIDNFYKLIKDNLNHPNAYVRRNAYYCLGSLYISIKFKEEIPDLLYNSLYRDLDPNCLKQAFASLYAAKTELAEKFIAEVSTDIPNELAATILEVTNDQIVLTRFLDSGDLLTSFDAAIGIHRISLSEEILKRATEVIIRTLEEKTNLKEFAIDTLYNSPYSFSGYAMDFLYMIDPYNINLSEKILDFVFKISEAHEFLKVSEYLSNKFKEASSLTLHKQDFKILLLNKMAYFANVYSTFNIEIVEESLNCIDSKNPLLAYAALNFINASLDACNRSYSDEKKSFEKIVSEVIKRINDIKYGKIIRAVFELLRKHVKTQFTEQILTLLDASFELEEKPLYLTSTSTFLGSFISISLSEMCKKEGKDTKAKAIAIMLKFISYGKKNNILDMTSHSTIISSIRNLLYQSNEKNISVVDHKKHYTDVLSPIECSELKGATDENISGLQEFLSTEKNDNEVKEVVQLSGLSDPIYVEASVKYARFEIILDILFINQTESHLQNVILDFATSSNFSSSFVVIPFTMAGNSAVTKTYTFKISESTTGFITGSLTFKYPNESGEYANSSYTINLAEVHTNISDFLEPLKVTSENFREQWKKLEWENTYSIRLQSNASLEEIFGGIAKGMKAEIISLECDKVYAVGNMVSHTLQNTSILINICMQKDEGIYFESRIRSKKEGIVKSISSIIGDILKNYKNK